MILLLTFEQQTEAAAATHLIASGHRDGGAGFLGHIATGGCRRAGPGYVVIVRSRRGRYCETEKDYVQHLTVVVEGVLP
jgi:hypothetical protein